MKLSEEQVREAVKKVLLEEFPGSSAVAGYVAGKIISELSKVEEEALLARFGSNLYKVQLR
jgi:hypothetical protein